MPVICPECGTATGPDTTTDTYYHARDCFNVPDKGPAYFLGDWKHDNPDFKKRVVFMMKAANQQLQDRIKAGA